MNGTVTRQLDLDALDRIAAAASTPDEWQWETHGDNTALYGKETGQVVLCPQEDEVTREPIVIVSEGDRAYIAAASPPVVRALIVRIRELEMALRLTSDAIAPQTGHAIGVLLAKGVVLPFVP